VSRKCFPALSQLDESATGPDSAMKNQRLAPSIHEPSSHGSR
jgi:hypothetical protein